MDFYSTFISNIFWNELQVVTVLHTPEVALNPAQPLEQRALEECPRPQEARADIGFLY